MNEKPSSKFLSIEEFAERLAVPIARVRRWIQEGRLPHVRVGRVVRIPADALERLIVEPRQ